MIPEVIIQGIYLLLKSFRVVSGLSYVVEEPACATFLFLSCRVVVKIQTNLLPFSSGVTLADVLSITTTGVTFPVSSITVFLLL